jgi:predicted acyltransferase
MGVLQRIALCYCFASLMIHFLSKQSVIILSVLFLAGLLDYPACIWRSAKPIKHDRKRGLFSWISWHLVPIICTMAKEKHLIPKEY